VELPDAHNTSVSCPRAVAALAHVAILCALAACGSDAARRGIYSGTIEAVEVDLVPEVSGRLIERPVDQGDQVASGDLVARIDAEPYRLALAETAAAIQKARAQLDLVSAGYRPEEIAAASRDVEEAEARVVQAASRLERVKDLVAQNVAAQDDLDIARRDLDAARARSASLAERLALLRRGSRPEEIASARADLARLVVLGERQQLDLDHTSVRSPIAGTVTEKLMEPGEYARAGSPIVSVADLEDLYTWVYVSEVELASLKLNQDVFVRIDGRPGQDYPGRIVYISKVSEFTPRNVQTAEDRVQLVYGVKVAVANRDGELKVGIPADVVVAGAAPAAPAGASAAPQR